MATAVVDTAHVEAWPCLHGGHVSWIANLTDPHQTEHSRQLIQRTMTYQSLQWRHPSIPDMNYQKLVSVPHLNAHALVGATRVLEDIETDSIKHLLPCFKVLFSYL